MSFEAVAIITAVIVALVSYLIGSVSFSIIFTRAYINKDIRQFGSGNAGLTNVLRSVGAMPGVLTFIGDFSKGILCTMLGYLVFKNLTVIDATYLIDPIYGKFIGGFFSFAGHLYPLYYGFKGGKGVLISAGIMLMLDLNTFLIVIGLFLLVFLLTRIISIGSIAAAASFPIVLFLTYSIRPEFIDQTSNAFFINQRMFETLFGVLFALIIITHKKSHPLIKRTLRCLVGQAPFGHS